MYKIILLIFVALIISVITFSKLTSYKNETLEEQETVSGNKLNKSNQSETISDSYTIGNRVLKNITYGSVCSTGCHSYQNITIDQNNLNYSFTDMLGSTPNINKQCITSKEFWEKLNTTMDTIKTINLPVYDDGTYYHVRGCRPYWPNICFTVQFTDNSRLEFVYDYDINVSYILCSIKANCPQDNSKFFKLENGKYSDYRSRVLQNDTFSQYFHEIVHQTPKFSEQCKTI